MDATPLTTLEDVKAYVAGLAEALDPRSRYVAELRALIDGCADVADLERRLSDGSRGLRHSGSDLFAQMTLRERLLANLVTPETALLRFTEGELEAIDRQIIPRLEGRAARVLIVPCSHGDEAFTMASFLLKRDIDFTIDAFDIQPALIDEARTGRLTFGFPPEFLRNAGHVNEAVLSRIRFEVGDAFALPIDVARRYDVIMCRNFVGYFLPQKARELVETLAGRVAPRGVLMLDSFCLGKFPELATALAALGAQRVDGRPVFLFA